MIVREITGWRQWAIWWDVYDICSYSPTLLYNFQVLFLPAFFTGVLGSQAQTERFGIIVAGFLEDCTTVHPVLLTVVVCVLSVCQPPPQLSAHVCCGQMARWIQMPLGREVSLGPGVIVLDGDPAPPKLWPNSHASQQLLSFCAGWMLPGQHWQDTRSNHPLASSFVDLLMKSWVKELCVLALQCQYPKTV